MARMSSLASGFLYVVSLVLGVGVLLSGCRHRLQPPPAAFPPPPPLACPQFASAAETDTGASTDSDPPGANKSIAAWPTESQPIDLPTALRLADAQNPEIAVARERIRVAFARQELAELLWVPNLDVGPTWMRHDGQIQRATGEVLTISRSSLFIGGGPALSVDVGEAIFAPLAARQITRAREAGAAATRNDRLLQVAVAYIDLLQALAELAINAEAYKNAGRLLQLTESYERTGKGAAADTARSRTEAYRRERQHFEIQGRIRVASARLVELLLLPPQFPLAPIDPAVVPVALVPEEMPLTNLLALAVSSRPELAENQAVIAAIIERWRAARLAPLLPELRLAYAAGGFGGGENEFFGAFKGRSDFAATAMWQLHNFGLGNLALTRERYAQYAQATFRQSAIEAEVAAQVVSSFSIAFAQRQELEIAQREVNAARESFRLNEDRIRRAPEQGRPIELLQAIQALAQARQDYLRVVSEYNRAQFRLYTALGNPPLCALDSTVTVPISESTVPPKPAPVEQLPQPRTIQAPQTDQ